ncbi:MAG TPA: AAA family ATPase [Vicinamibacteria bacterium]|nr:AAA family ATPase [Vicinamibacteria bacterium]
MTERLHRLVMRAFRGVPGEMTVDFGKGESLAVYGDNGTGKSTIADALEWYFTGEIELLSHEGRQHAIRHLGGNDAATSVEIATSGELGGRVEFPDARSSDTVALAGRETFLLRGRTLADFINKTKTEKWKALVDILGLADIEGLRQDLQKARNELRKLAKAAEEDVRTARRALGGEGAALSEEAVLEQIQGFCANLGIQKPRLLDDVVDPGWVRDAVGNLVAPSPGNRESLGAEIRALERPHWDKAVLEHWKSLVEGERAAELPRVSLLREAKTLLETAGSDGSCPLCGQKIDITELSSRIASVLATLLETSRELEDGAEKMKALVDRLALAEQRRSAIRQQAAKLSLGLPALPASPQSALSEAIEARRAPDVAAVESYLQALARWDEEAHTAGGGSTPSTTREQQLVLLATLCEHVKLWRASEARARLAIAASSLADRVFDAYQDRQKQDLSELLQKISRRVAEIYAGLHPGENLSSVGIEPWTAKGVELAIDFYGTRQRPPHGVLSESHLNSLAIALFLAMAETFNEKLGFLVLDDVINSFDLEHRGQLAEMLARDFSSWQLILLTHDHQFFEQTVRRAPSWKRLELTSWSYGEGPRTSAYDPSSILGAARSRLEAGDANGAATKARRALEEQLQEVCQALRARLPFRRGAANDRRELGELFAGVRRALKDTAKPFLNELDGLLRGLEADVQATLNVEAHASGTRSGASEVAAALARIEELDRKWSCPHCSTRVWYKGTPDASRCKCGRSVFPPASA